MIMKKINTILIFVFLFSLFSGLAVAQKQVDPTKPKNSQNGVDTRVDNMGYWGKMAEQGLVPVAPVVQIPEAVYTGSMITAKSVKSGKEDSPDVPVSSATNVTESENSIFVNPADNDFILNSNNSTSWSGGSIGTLYGANAFFSEDAGLLWGGSAQGAGGNNYGDPTTAINLDGSRMYVNYISMSSGMGISYSTNSGTTWSATTVTPNPGSMTDKNHMWIDNSPVSPYLGNLYVAWTDFGGANNNQICIKASTNGGLNWGSLINVSSAVNAGSHNQGVNIQTGPNGQVYVIWAVYDSWPQDEKAIGFAKSLNGGTSYTPGTRIINNTRGIRNTTVNKNHRVNSFPAMAVDISGGAYNGTIYVVWSNIGVPGVNTGTSADVYVIKSSDEGASWSTPVKINTDAPGMGKKHYFPWITCDPETGILSVIFYDDRNTTSNQCETWCANSMDGGETWEDFKVSDVAFTPSYIPGLAEGYMGDYLGITARGSKVYPTWTDTRNSKFMTYTSPYVTNNLPKPTNLTLLLDEVSGAIDMGWIFDGDDFLFFNVYRDNVLLGTTTELTYSDILPNYGVFTYKVTAMHTDGESVPAAAMIQWGNPHIAVTPDAINVGLEVGGSTTETITVENVGQLDLIYTVSPMITGKKKAKDYCSASGGCDEFISNVAFGDINNPSSCDGYADYTNLSTVVSPGQSYPISITNGNTSYPADQCGIWVDWNQDQDFGDAGEAITVTNTPGVGPYLADIIPPAGALAGETTLRVRITYTGAVDPCGTAQYGEVEDYSVFVLGWLQLDNYGDTLLPGETATINVMLDAAELEEGVYTADINIGSNDPDLMMVTVPITLTVGEQILQANFTSNTIGTCVQEVVTYNDLSTGGATSWEWAFEGGTPATSTLQNPEVVYFNGGVFDVSLTVSDGINSNTMLIEDYMTITGMPEVPTTPTGIALICTNWADPTPYTTTAAANAESYVWEIMPDEAGTISGSGITATVTWTLNWEGTATIRVKSLNEICGESEFSETFDVVCSICTGINNYADLSDVQIYPNPTTGKFNVSFNYNIGFTEISVMNMLNKVVFYENTETLTGKTLGIDLSDLSKGVYIIKLKTDRQEETRKIIVQ
jgi:PKD repeat protein